MTQPVGAAIVGVGRWGRKLAGKLAAHGRLVAYASSGSQDNIDWMTAHHATARSASLADICSDKAISVVAVATPIPTHAAIVRLLLEAGKNVFVEKPLGSSAHEAGALAKLARERGLLLATGYVLLLHPVYRELKRRTAAAPIRKVEFSWSKFGSFDEPIELNLLTHHLAIVLDLIGEPLGGSLRRGAGVRSACDAIEATLCHRDTTVTSIIDRHASDISHTMTVDLADGVRYRWDRNTLAAGRSGTAALSNIFQSEIEPLDEEIVRFIETTRDPSLALPTRGEFAARVLNLLETLTPLR